MTSAARLVPIYLVSALAGWLFARIGAPLPWMIGPLVSTMLISASGYWPVRVPATTRPIGQITVATFVGAHFTPDAFHAVRDSFAILIGCSLYVLALALAVSWLQWRLFGTDRATGFLSAIPTSPVEAGIIAEENGLPVAPVIFSQTLRIALVVTIFPLLFTALGSPHRVMEPAPEVWGMLPLLITLAAALSGPLLFRAVGLANPFFLGTLFCVALVAGSGLPVHTVPAVLLAGAQVILGTWLGGCFQRETLIANRRQAVPILFSTCFLLGACLLGARLLHLSGGGSFATLSLGIAPGGVTEMALTAGILGLDVAFVTAMHLSRIFIIMPNIGWIARMIHGRNGDR